MNHRACVKALTWMAFLVAVSILGLAPMSICAQARPVPDVMVFEWANANSNCLASLRRSKTDMYCQRRDALTGALKSNGYRLTSHDVWISPAQMHYFESVVFKAGMQAGVHPESSASIRQEMLMLLHMKLKDREIFAIWNDPTIRSGLERQSPHGYPLMNDLMQELARNYSRSQDPALTLGHL